MSDTGLTSTEVALMTPVFSRHPDIIEVLLFGSRAKGTHRPQSDVDLALVGVADNLIAEAVAETLEALPMPYRFDVKPYDGITYQPLLDHIQRVGISLYRRSE